MQESDKRDLGKVTEAETKEQRGPISTAVADFAPGSALNLTVTRDVLSLATRMAEALELAVPENAWPTIQVSAAAKTSSYSPAQNCITIATGHLNDGSTYAEEVTHFLKAAVTPQPEVLSDGSGDMDDYKTFQEFCGRLGREFAKRICIGTDLEHLFAAPLEDEGAALTQAVAHTAGKLERALSGIDGEIQAVRASAALFGDLLSQVDRILDEEWQGDTHELPRATALIKQRASELLGSTDTPACAVERLSAIIERVETKSALTTFDVSQVVDLIRAARNADEARVMSLSLGSSLASSALTDAQVHARAYTAAEALMREHPETWPELFKKSMHLSLAEARDPQGSLASL